MSGTALKSECTFSRHIHKNCSYQESPASPGPGPPKKGDVCQLTPPSYQVGRGGAPLSGLAPGGVNLKLQTTKSETTNKSTAPKQSSTGTPLGAGGGSLGSNKQLSCVHRLGLPIPPTY